MSTLQLLDAAGRRRSPATLPGFLRVRALIVVLWRAGLWIGEAMALTEPDLDPGRGSVLVRQGKGGKRREVGMDQWGFDQLRPWLARRVGRPVGTFCVIDGQARGRPWTPAAARNHLWRIATKAGVRRCFAPHQLRHAHAVEMAREGVQLKVIQRQLGHVNLGVIIDTVHNRRPPMISASAGLMI
jgi:site-specific recombinase XerD